MHIFPFFLLNSHIDIGRYKFWLSLCFLLFFFFLFVLHITSLIRRGIYISIRLSVHFLHSDILCARRSIYVVELVSHFFIISFNIRFYVYGSYVLCIFCIFMRSIYWQLAVKIKNSHMFLIVFDFYQIPIIVKYFSYQFRDVILFFIFLEVPPICLVIYSVVTSHRF